MPRYLTSAIFTDVAVTMSTFIASRREPWYEAISSIMIDSAHRADQVRRWSRRSSYRDRHELILCVRWLLPSRPVMEPSRTLAGVINTTHPGRDRMASRMLSSGCLRQLESDGRRMELDCAARLFFYDLNGRGGARQRAESRPRDGLRQP